jgi:D-alanyl-D-alanine dipeptidase
MTAKEYCELVERLDRFQKQLISTIPIKEDNSPLISLKESNFNLIFEPSFYKDYKYMVREAVFEKIGRISKILDKQNKRLIIRSVWRSYAHQKLLRDRRVKIIKKKYPDKSLKEIIKLVSYFIAPEEKSMHSTGGAVDALIYDLKKDCVMDFGNNDGLKLELNKTCYPFHPDITAQARKNRELLISLFDKEDFVVDPTEYWHFDYGNVIWAIEKGKKYARYGIIKA